MGSARKLVNKWRSRERKAGYDPELLATKSVLVVGAGALGNNVLLTFALSGIGRLRVVDHDFVELHNVTRSPLFKEIRLGKQKWMKAQEAGIGIRSLGLAKLPTYQYATTKIEELGMAAIASANVVVGCVDSNEVRALLADWCRLLGIPYVEGGFRKEWFNVSMFPNHNANDPCWRCAHPDVEPGNVSCTLYAQEVVSAGLVPAIQTTAAASGALVAEAAIMALHGQFPLGNRRMYMNIRTGRSDLVELVADGECPGPHEIWSTPTPLSVGPDDSLSLMLSQLKQFIDEPVVELPFPFIVELPCRECGQPIPVNQPSWAVKTAPLCQQCPEESSSHQVTVPLTLTEIREGKAATEITCQQVGLGPAAIFCVYSAALDQSGVFRLAGGSSELFQELF